MNIISEYKISIIIPIYNAENFLKQTLDSLINQTMDYKNLEVIMVDNVSTDNSKNIINEYENKYENFKGVYRDINSGSCAEPRNDGISIASGEYIMFLDSDDTYTSDCCETLYDAIKKYDADVSFGRHKRIYINGKEKGKIQKSISPFKDDISKLYPNETIEDFNPLNTSPFLWNHVFKHFLYGKNIKGKYDKNKVQDVVYLDKIGEELDLLKISPSVWSKIFKREFINKLNLKFYDLTGEDQLFMLECYFNAKGIVFLNNYFDYNYYIRNAPEDKSMINTPNLKLLTDLMNSFILINKICEKYKFPKSDIIIHPHLFHWILLWTKGDFTKEENKKILSRIKELQNDYKHSKVFLTLIKLLIKTSMFFKSSN